MPYIISDHIRRRSADQISNLDTASMNLPNPRRRKKPSQFRTRIAMLLCCALISNDETSIQKKRSISPFDAKSNFYSPFTHSLLVLCMRRETYPPPAILLLFKNRKHTLKHDIPKDLHSILPIRLQPAKTHSPSSLRVPTKSNQLPRNGPQKPRCKLDV